LLLGVKKEFIMKALVTGSTGMLGHNLVRQLLAEGWQVKALVRSKEKAGKLFMGLTLEVIEGDMDNLSGFSAVLEGIDAVFHTAAYFREYFTHGNDHWSTLKRINIDATLALIEASEKMGVKTFIHTSSSGSISIPINHVEANENTPLAIDTQNLYFKSKVEGDQAIAKWVGAAPRAMKVVTILPGFMIAPRDAAPTSGGKLILDFMTKKIPGVIKAGTSTVDARDVANAMIKAVKHGRQGEKYIVAGQFVEFAKLFKLLEQISGVKAPTLQMPNWFILTLARVDTYVSGLQQKTPTMPLDGIQVLLALHSLSSKKAITELGVTFRPFEETLSDTINWYKDNGYISTKATMSNKASA
jgi:dihydroflavonol-4-reductase